MRRRYRCEFARTAVTGFWPRTRLAAKLQAPTASATPGKSQRRPRSARGLFGHRHPVLPEATLDDRAASRRWTFCRSALRTACPHDDNRARMSSGSGSTSKGARRSSCECEIPVVAAEEVTGGAVQLRESHHCARERLPATDVRAATGRTALTRAAERGCEAGPVGCKSLDIRRLESDAGGVSCSTILRRSDVSLRLTFHPTPHA